MKKLSLFVGSIALCLTSFAQLRVGLSGVYATEIDQIAPRLNVAYGLSETFEVAANLDWFFENDFGVSYQMFDIDGHYLFGFDKLNVYPLAGLNILRATATFFGQKESNSELGLNVGAGARIPISDKASIVPEIKYTLIEGENYARLGLGVHFNL